MKRDKVHEPSARFILAILVLVATIGTSASAAAQETYWMDEGMDFNPSQGCQQLGDLNDVTSSLKQRMDADGWTGSRWTEWNAWPQDFVDPTLVVGGIDSSAADTRGVAVYAGHGATTGDFLSFSRPRLGVCGFTQSTQMRLGTLAGDTAYAAIYMTSCTMNTAANPTANFTNTDKNQTWQEFGFHNSPTIQSGAGGDFFDCTQTGSNVDCWIDYMEHKYEFWWGLNSPVVLSKGQSLAATNLVHDFCALKAGACTSSASEPWTNWIIEWHDHGADSCS